MKPCPFCAILDGSAPAPDDLVTTDNVASFTPLNPVVPGHRLFVPTAHVPDAGKSPTQAGRVMKFAARHAQYERVPFNLITSAGAAATQTVPHLHIHYIPRAEGDGLALPWTGQEGQ